MQAGQVYDLPEEVVEVVLLLWVEVVEGHQLKVGEEELGPHALEEVEVVELHEGEGGVVVVLAVPELEVVVEVVLQAK